MSKRKHVIFEEHESDLLQHSLNDNNFSKYVKRLIKADMARRPKKPSIYEIYNEKVHQQ